jgi:hypothetical protein
MRLNKPSAAMARLKGNTGNGTAAWRRLNITKPSASMMTPRNMIKRCMFKRVAFKKEALLVGMRWLS